MMIDKRKYCAHLYLSSTLLRQRPTRSQKMKLSPRLAQHKMTQTSPLSTFQSLRLYQDFDLLDQIQHRGRCDIYHVVSKRGRLRNRAMALKEVHDNSGGPLIHQALHHPGVVSLYSIFEHEGTWIHVMEYCPGGSLADRLAESMLEVQELLSLFRGLANALVYLESNQIIHRDIEPSNILITSGQGFKLSNFREATYCTSAAKEPCRKLSFCTSPEIAAQEPQSCSADAWSLGCVLLAALIGPSAVEQLEQGSISIDSIPPDESDEAIQELIVQLLQVKPSQRLSPSQALAHPWAQPKCGDLTAQREDISTSFSSNRAKEDRVLTNHFPAECSIGRPSISEIAKKEARPNQYVPATNRTSPITEDCNRPIVKHRLRAIKYHWEYQVTIRKPSSRSSATVLHEAVVQLLHSKYEDTVFSGRRNSFERKNIMFSPSPAN